MTQSSGVTSVEPPGQRERRLQLEALRTRMISRKLRMSQPNFPDLGSSIKGLFNQMADLSYWLPWEVLDYLELLSTYNADFSQAVDNIRTLANSGHHLYVEASSPRRSNTIKGRLEEKARTIQEGHGGIDGIIDKLLDQAAVYGAMCGEWVLTESLDDVLDFRDINPKYIRFFWNESKQAWIPHQRVGAEGVKAAEGRGQKVIEGGFVELNPTTFRYFAFDAAPGSPYGTPPFLAALGPIAIQRDMIANMSQIVKKIGLLGVIDMAVKQLPARPNETDEQYQARAGAYLDDYAEVVEEMIREGGMVHFDDVEVHNYALAGNAAGATNIFKQNEEQVFSGLKSMPSVQGRSYSTTETYAGVAYDIIIRQTERYQRAAKRMIEAGYWLMATLWGETPKKISIDFKYNKTLQRLQDAQAFRIEILNQYSLWDGGIINQEQVAQELGYQTFDKPLDSPPRSRRDQIDLPPEAGGGISGSGDDV